MSSDIDCIDFAPLEASETSEAAQECVERLMKALKGSGAAYVKSSHVTQNDIQSMLDWNAKLFKLPQTEMAKLAQPDDWKIDRGHTAAGAEVLEDGAAELKESYEIGPDDATRYVTAGEVKNIWPEEHVLPGFRAAANDFAEHCQGLVATVFKALTLGMPQVPTGFLKEQHTDGYHLRLLHYPAVTNGSERRLGAHVDFGSFTFLFQDLVGGLEIESAAHDGEFIPVPAIPGTAFIHIGEIMTRWSNDLLHPTMHRVVSQKAADGSVPDRYSIAFYTVPNTKSDIDALPGTFDWTKPKNYPKVSVADFMNAKYKQYYPDKFKDDE